MGTLKRRSRISRILLGMLAVAAVCGPMAFKARATPYWWDTNGSSAGAGDTSSGTWGSNCTDWTPPARRARQAPCNTRRPPATLILSPLRGPIAVRILIRSRLPVIRTQIPLPLHPPGLPRSWAAARSTSAGSGGITVSNTVTATPQGAVTISPQIALQAPNLDQ